MIRGTLKDYFLLYQVYKFLEKYVLFLNMGIFVMNWTFNILAHPTNIFSLSILPLILSMYVCKSG